MTLATVIFAASVYALPQPMQFTGKPDAGVSIEVPETTEFTVSVWVDVQNAGSDTVPYPRIFQLPCGYLHLLRDYGFPDAASLLLGLSISKEVVPRGVSSWQFDGAIPLKRWAHVAVVCRTDGNVPPEIYVNGALVKPGASAKPLPAVFKGGRAELGNLSPGGNRPLDGRLADFRFEPRAFSAEEVYIKVIPLRQSVRMA